MKTFKLFLSIIVLALFSTSCLEANLKTLDTYEGNDITTAYVYYRYKDANNTWPLSGDSYVKQVTMKVSNKIDASAGTCNIAVSVPSNFPESEKSKLSASQLVVAVSISTAAVISPTGDSPALGTPADWSSPHKYVVEAANGDKKEWTITVTLTK